LRDVEPERVDGQRAVCEGANKRVAKAVVGGARRGGRGIVAVGDDLEIAVAFCSLAAADCVSAVGYPELAADALGVRRVCRREIRRHERASEERERAS